MALISKKTAARAASREPGVARALEAMHAPEDRTIEGLSLLTICCDNGALERGDAARLAALGPPFQAELSAQRARSGEALREIWESGGPEALGESRSRPGAAIALLLKAPVSDRAQALLKEALDRGLPLPKGPIETLLSCGARDIGDRNSPDRRCELEFIELTRRCFEMCSALELAGERAMVRLLGERGGAALAIAPRNPLGGGAGGGGRPGGAVWLGFVGAL